MLERDQGDEVRFDMDEFRAKAEELDGWSAVVLIRPDSVAFRVVSPERRRELIEQGWYAY